MKYKMKCPNGTCKEISCNHRNLHELNRGCLSDAEGCPSCELVPELKYKYLFSVPFDLKFELPSYRFRKLLTLKSILIIIVLVSILILINP